MTTTDAVPASVVDAVDLRLDHIGISVPDMAVATEFYGTLLGLREVRRKTWENDARMDAILGLPGTAGTQVLLTDGGFGIELWRFDNPASEPQDPDRPASRHGLAHIAVRVGDIAGIHARLAAAGTRFHCAPSPGPTGSVATYARDPFGNIVELVQPAPEWTGGPRA